MRKKPEIFSIAERLLAENNFFCLELSDEKEVKTTIKIWRTNDGFEILKEKHPKSIVGNHLSDRLHISLLKPNLGNDWIVEFQRFIDDLSNYGCGFHTHRSSVKSLSAYCKEDIFPIDPYDQLIEGLEFILAKTL